MIGYFVGTNSEFIKDRRGREGGCVCVLGVGGRQADHQSHTNIPTDALNKNNTVSHRQLRWNFQIKSKIIHNCVFTKK